MLYSTLEGLFAQHHRYSPYVASSIKQFAPYRERLISRTSMFHDNFFNQNMKSSITKPFFETTNSPLLEDNEIFRKEISPSEKSNFEVNIDFIKYFY